MCRMSVYTPRADFEGSGSQRTVRARAFLGSLSCTLRTIRDEACGQGPEGDGVVMTMRSHLKECCRSFEDPPGSDVRMYFRAQP